MTVKSDPRKGVANHEDMRFNRRHILKGAGIAGAAGLAAFVPTATVARAASADDNGDGGLVGAWLGTATLTGQPPSFGTLLSFAEGGTLTHSTAIDLESAQLSSPSYGAWKRIHANTYAVRFVFFTFDAQTNPSGSGEVTERVTVDGDHLSGTLTVTVFDSAGIVVFSGPGTIEAKRINAD